MPTVRTFKAKESVPHLRNEKGENMNAQIIVAAGWVFLGFWIVFSVWADLEPKSTNKEK